MILHYFVYFNIGFVFSNWIYLDRIYTINMDSYVYKISILFLSIFHNYNFVILLSCLLYYEFCILFIIYSTNGNPKKRAYSK